MKTGVVGYGAAAQFMHLPFLVTNPELRIVNHFATTWGYGKRKISRRSDGAQPGRNAG